MGYSPGSFHTIPDHRHFWQDQQTDLPQRKVEKEFYKPMFVYIIGIPCLNFNSPTIATALSKALYKAQKFGAQ